MLNEPPLEWGKTMVTEYFEASRSNAIATYHTNKAWFQKLERIDSIFRTVIDNLYNSTSVIPSFFLLRTHAGYLSAFQLACSGQITESYAIMRNCIEASLYAYHVYEVPNDQGVWMNRNDDPAAKKACRSMFAFGNVLSTLSREDAKLSGIVDSLYDRLIDYGGHPNPFSILTNLTMEKIEGIVDFKLFYLNPGGIQQDLAVKSLAQVGLTCLFIFKKIWKERFDIMNISDQLERERPNL